VIARTVDEFTTHGEGDADVDARVGRVERTTDATSGAMVNSTTGDVGVGLVRTALSE
jgi:hypothetical protein